MQADRPHQLQSVAGLHNARFELVVENQLAIGKPIFKMEVCCTAAERFGNIRQCQVMRTDHANRIPLHKCAHNKLAAHKPVVRIRP